MGDVKKWYSIHCGRSCFLKQNQTPVKCEADNMRWKGIYAIKKSIHRFKEDIQ